MSNRAATKKKPCLSGGQDADLCGAFILPCDPPPQSFVLARYTRPLTQRRRCDGLMARQGVSCKAYSLGEQSMFVRIAADESGSSGAEYAALLTILLAGTVGVAMFLTASIGGAINGTAADITNANSGQSSQPSGNSPENHGRSDESPGHEMLQQGSAPGAPGASGYAPGHK